MLPQFKSINEMIQETYVRKIVRELKEKTSKGYTD